MPATVAELTIDSIAAGGDGVGRHGGLVAFVPRTAPGDVVRARLRTDGRLARGRLDAVLTPSAQRVEPPCAHYVVDRCGGCQLQHLALDAQREAKRAMVQDALTRIARRPYAVPATIESPSPWRYRRKLTLAMRRVGAGWIAGLRAYDDPDAVFALADCPITDARVVAAWRAILAAAPLLPAGARELRGAVRLLDGETDGGSVAFTLEGGTRWSDAQAFFDAVPVMAALWWQPAGGRRRMLCDRRADASAGRVLRAGQSRRRGAPERRAPARGCSRTRPARVVDAYAGSGDLSAALAQAGVAVTAIELDPDAAAHAATRLAPPSRAVAATVEDALPGALPADVVVVNPPRGGLDARVCATLEEAARGLRGVAPRALLYVSCNPATLARDLARLPTYALRAVQPLRHVPADRPRRDARRAGAADRRRRGGRMKYVVDLDGERTVVELTGDEVRVGDETVHAHLVDVEGTPVSLLTIGDQVYRLVARRGDARGAYTIDLGGRRFDVEALDERTRTIRDLSAAAQVAAGPSPLAAPMPGLVVRVHVAVGDEVVAGQGLVVMEAMKMENELARLRGGHRDRRARHAGNRRREGRVAGAVLLR